MNIWLVISFWCMYCLIAGTPSWATQLSNDTYTIIIMICMLGSDIRRRM